TPAGFIASRRGSAIQAPAPRSTVRRERCFFVMNMRTALLSPRFAVSGKRAPTPFFARSVRRHDGALRLRGPAHQERIARHDLPDDRREAIVVLCGFADDPAHG